MLRRISSRSSPKLNRSKIAKNRRLSLQPFTISYRVFSKDAIRDKIRSGPSLQDFMTEDANTEIYENADPIPYVHLDPQPGEGRKVHIETYGCQMNVADTEIVQSIMESNGYQICNNAEEANIIFLNTCAIRDKAEQKIWHRLEYLKSLKKKRKKTEKLLVGVLGCMAERLKLKLIESDKLVDIVVGPDAYRDLPRLVHDVDGGSDHAINVILSQDETYADISPVRTDKNGVSSFVSIMRGCNNMCTYCIVPFTRGRERSRDVNSILREVKELSDKGYKEVVLLGQNVNSYNYRSNIDPEEIKKVPIAEGFSTVYKRPDQGVGFAELVDRVSDIDPEMRVRFTSPHPKDFPDELLEILNNKPNVCKSIHIPIQSGSTEVLKSMRRGYSKEAYLSLIDRIKTKVPDITLSSDFISGFCGETEQDHRETIDILEKVKYDFAFMFAYSMREKTPAHRRLKDDVPEDVKKERLNEVISTFHRIAIDKGTEEVGKTHIVLIDGYSKRSDDDLRGRTDTNKKVIFPNKPIPDMTNNETPREAQPGDYVIVNITDSKGLTLMGKPVGITTLSKYAQEYVI
eukprot:TRINITY_DN9433_c0_g1_i1.p1 TRINITY_DN9433_c0_g1~~TRINITY_DN9433_c0_g1_i1.p1  ORF type:complete len:573 (-),score=141.96 TRINITY_DN9433_c0_g1_i1:37-1755(-)